MPKRYEAGPGGLAHTSAACRVCRQSTSWCFQHAVLGRYSVSYFQCSHCGLLQTEEPYWLQEAYSSPIASADTGIAQRNWQLAARTSLLFYWLYGRSGCFIDVAGGYGLFVRLMRDRGFDFYWQDPYAPNLFARGFEPPAASSNALYCAATAFEVLEHLVDPLGFLRQTLAATSTRTVIFTTELFEGSAPQPDQWWYYVF